MDKVKGIPYGVASFEEVRREDFYYVDKTMYLPAIEEMNKYLFLIRPRRFGKSVFVSMMRAYYDIARADSFDALFEGLWIHERPTPLKNAFQIVYFDFSLIGVGDGMADLSRRFNSYCGMVLDLFADTYAKYYGEGFAGKVKGFETASDKLNYINLQAHEKGYPLYLIIDEYDNFTNVILSEGGTEMFRKLTHASGFYREYFKIFKVMFSRVFLIGVSPVTLDDLSSGYNIDWNISQDPRFNHMLGFSESEVREMFRYYQTHGKLRAEADIEAMSDPIEIKMMRVPYMETAQKENGEYVKINYAATADYMIIPAQAPNIEGAKEFLIFSARDDMLQMFTKYTGATRPFTYDLTPVQDTLSTFAQSCLEIATTSETYFDISYSPLYVKGYAKKFITAQPWSLLVYGPENDGTTPQRFCDQEYLEAEGNWAEWVANSQI